MSKFKVGDKVRVVFENKHYGHTGIITEGDKINGFMCSCGEQTSWMDSSLELIEEETCEPCRPQFRVDDFWGTARSTVLMDEMSAYQWDLPKTINKIKKQTFMSKATNYIKNLTLSADEKLLRKFGFKNDCGEFTSEAMELVELKLVKDNENYLIEIAKGLEAEAKENK